MLTNTDAWVDRYAEAGSNLLTVHRQFCHKVSITLQEIRSRGVHAGLVVELGDPLSVEDLHLDIVDRLLVMGTEIGVKGKVYTPTLRENWNHSGSLRSSGSTPRDRRRRRDSP